MKEAMFAAGCFWGVEQYFRAIPGVLDVAVGYSGGNARNPIYTEVCTGRTGHAEAVHITYDPEKITYWQLLNHFWQMHNPTTPNRQGPDIGTQYRSAIFYYDSEQRDQAMDYMGMLASRLDRAIVTEISPAGIFWRAEEYHQRYFEKNPGRGCHI
jgi:peptide-methionine (S)-S-oxide reductase